MLVAVAVAMVEVADGRDVNGPLAGDADPVVWRILEASGCKEAPEGRTVAVIVGKSADDRVVKVEPVIDRLNLLPTSGMEMPEEIGMRDREAPYGRADSVIASEDIED